MELTDEHEKAREAYFLACEEYKKGLITYQMYDLAWCLYRRAEKKLKDQEIVRAEP